MANGRGGVRQGSGRPRKTDLYESEIRAAERRIADKLPNIVDCQLELAEGVLVEGFDLITGQPRVYKHPPERQAIEYLMNRIMGKPTERVEVDDAGRMSDDELISEIAGIIRGSVPEGAADTGDEGTEPGATGSTG